jgi:hypothetical protein
MKRLTRSFDNESREVTNALKRRRRRASPPVFWADLPTHDRMRVVAAIAQDTATAVIAPKLSEG